ncbi:MAG TPA: thioredoxin family protein, partial [Spirochaetota bacterium]|nr:thioredoxin family protein [Spirochaetota bacterium]
FDIFTLDFSRLRNKLPGFKNGSTGVFFMGSVTALLAGACVAPVLIAVLLYSANMYSDGYSAALLLPFVLGIGMALPWPLIGAGFSILPRPGPWMSVVKKILGILILALAFYYGRTAYQLYASETAAAPARRPVPQSGQNMELYQKLYTARKQQKPVLLDFGASWCKNCLIMDRTTLQHPRITSLLQDYIVIKYYAEDPGLPLTKAVLDLFQVNGLPTYINLKPTTGLTNEDK